MKKEIQYSINPMDRRQFLQAAGSTLASLFVANWFLDNLEPEYALAYNQKRDISCLPDNENATSKYPFDAIVVPGGGVFTDENGNSEPNVFQKLRLEAAAAAFIKGAAPFIILLDGQREDHVQKSMNKNYLINAVDELSEGKVELRANQVLVEDKSVNTSTNMEELANIILEQKIKEKKPRNIERVLIISNSFHIQRAAAEACSNEISADAVSAEEILYEINPDLLLKLDEFYEEHPEVAEDQMNKEYEAIMLDLIDPDDILNNLRKKLTALFRYNYDIITGKTEGVFLPHKMPVPELAGA